MTKILKKVSVKTVCNKPKSFFKELKEETPMMRIVGLARKYDIGTSQYGEYLKFIGEFHATDLSTGEQSVGAVAFLPQPVDGMLKESIDSMSEGGKKPVEFAFDIFVIPDPATEVGFQYRVAALTETKTSDPLAELLNKYSNVPMLAAPKNGEAETPLESESEPSEKHELDYAVHEGNKETVLEGAEASQKPASTSRKKK